MKIFILPVNSDGCTHYRINKPYKALNDKGVIFFENKDLETPEALQYLEECDYILCRQYHDKSIKVLDNLFNSKGANEEGKTKKLKVILDMDDYVFDIDPYSESYGVFGTEEIKHGDKWLWKDGDNINIKKNREYNESLKWFLRRADILTVSTERLKERYKIYNDNIVVVPNAIDPKDWIVPNFKKHKKIRIGWTGGNSHYKDWYGIKDDIERIMKEYPQIQLVIGGSMFEGIFKNIDKDRIEYWNWIDPTGHGYRVSMMDLDLAIVPLESSLFNSNKSCIKFYEFSALKIPTICSDVAPYKDECPDESLAYRFYPRLKHLIENTKEAKELGEKNYKWVMANRNQNKISDNLKKVLNANN